MVTLLLKLLHTRTKVTLGDCAFSCAAQKPWNTYHQTQEKPDLLLSSNFC